jgi:hypothetical protein
LEAKSSWLSEADAATVSEIPTDGFVGTEFHSVLVVRLLTFDYIKGWAEEFL